MRTTSGHYIERMRFVTMEKIEEPDKSSEGALDAKLDHPAVDTHVEWDMEDARVDTKEDARDAGCTGGQKDAPSVDREDTEVLVDDKTRRF